MTNDETGKVSEQAQRLILKVLYDHNEDWVGIGTTRAAELLGKPKFTAMRAFDELAAIGPSLVKTENRVRWLTPGNRKSFLLTVASHLFNPVVREYRLERIPEITPLPLSGLAAISYYTDFEAAPFPTFAITKVQERKLGLQDGKGMIGWQGWDNPACIIQVMRYDLDSMGEAAIDPVSTILSLSEAEMEDPQLNSAMVSMLEKVLTSK